MKRKKTSKGSAGDHLANERTFLAWIRTAIGIIGLGFVIIKSTNFLTQINHVTLKGDDSERWPYIIGLLFVFFGPILILLAMMSYHKTEKMLHKGLFESSTLLIKCIAAITAIFSLLLAIYLSH